MHVTILAVDLTLRDHPVLILLFGMEGCPACTSTLPIFRRVAELHNTVPSYAIDCNKASDVADRFNVRVTPTTFLLRYGRVVRRFEGEGSVADIEKLFKYAEGMR